MKRLLVLVAAFALVLAACGSDDGGSVRDSGSGSGSASGSGSGSGPASGSTAETKCETVGDKADATTTVDVELNEFTITVDTKSVSPGTVHFAVANKGKEAHELVIIKGVAPADLPLDKDGALDESGLPKGALIGEVEPFPGGKTCDGTFELPAGEYTLVCNITEKEHGETESHLHKGMITTLAVT